MVVPVMDERQIKLCVYLSNPAGHRAVFEQVVNIPAGYGFQRSNGYNCSNFSRYSAQDYFWLYPGDPSGLDADNDGAACEFNDGPSPGPRIPAEPQPAAPTLPTPLAVCGNGVDDDGDGRTDLDDPGCTGSGDGSERDPVYRLTGTKARSVARTVLAERFGRYFTRRTLEWACRRRSAAKFSCAVDWFWPPRLNADRFRQYVGRVAIRRVTGDEYTFALRIRMTAFPSLRTKVFKAVG